MHIEYKRQSLHIALFILAFALKWLTRPQALAVLFGLFIFVTVLLPRWQHRHHFYRLHERRYSYGAIFYVLVLLLLIVLFDPAVVAGSWAILALGDGFATLVGKHFRARPLPWNPNKPYAGTAAFFVWGSLGASLLLFWMKNAAVPA